MATPQVKKTYDRQHLQHLSAYAKRVDALWKKIIAEAATLGATVYSVKGGDDAVFAFDDYPSLKKRADALFSEAASGLNAIVVNGVDAEWTLANDKNSELARRVFGEENVGKLTQAQYRKYFSTNDAARKAFLARTEQGLNLSERVWRYADQFKREIELGLDVGIRNGTPASEMATELKAWLREPDKLFRRVRDAHGNLVPSRAMEAYHSGRGVYRSSYKNARRLAVTETNMAYRNADYERWQQQPFVVGIEIRLSNNHPVPDICDDLKGRYPKDFKWTGWHPHCRCHAVPILKTEDEIAEDTQRILAGEEPNAQSVNRVSDVPAAYREWCGENRERFTSEDKLPYFLRDNGRYSSAGKKTGGDYTVNDFSLSEVKPVTAGKGEIAPMTLASIVDEGYVVRGRKRNYWTREMEDVDLADLEEDWAGTPFAKIDFRALRSEMLDAFKAVGGEAGFSPRIGYRASPDGGRVSIEFVSKDITVRRLLQFDWDGKLYADNELFKIPKTMQGRGTSKAVLGAFHKQFKRIGVERVEVFANIDVGGYTWGRYGFKTMKNDVQVVIDSYIDQHGTADGIGKGAQKIVDDFYASHNRDELFPMRVLTEQPWGRDLLMGRSWSGEIDLTDSNTVELFERYIATRSKRG